MKIKVALDWTPNANHAGFYLALFKGWYKDVGLDVELISPEKDNYTTSPIEKLFRKQVSLAITPSESVIRSHISGYKELQAIATILQKDPSAFATLKESGLDTLKKLKGKTYAALELPFEKNIVGKLTGGEYKTETPEKLSIYDLFFAKKVDFVWMYKNIEVAEAKLNGTELNLFDLESAGIPYGHCPLLISHREFLTDYSFLFKKFLEVTARAYTYVVTNTEDTLETLTQKGEKIFQNTEALKATVQASSEYYLNKEKQWGIMDNERWDNYLNWLADENLIRRELVKSGIIFTNQYLQKIRS